MHPLMLGSARILVAVFTIGTLTTTMGERIEAQSPATPADIQKLEQIATEVEADVSRVADRDAELAAQLLTELAEARDEITYLRVKRRREGRLSRDEYLVAREMLVGIQRRAQASSIEVGRDTVPVGTEIDVRLQSRLTSKTAVVEDRVEATTIADVRSDGRVLIPAGAVVRGLVTEVKKAGRVHRKGSISLKFDQITIDGRTHDMMGTVTHALESEGVSAEKAKIGTGAGVGAVIGGILGGFKGALAGILIGAGGTVAATEGENVDLPPGTLLRVRIDSALHAN